MSEVESKRLLELYGLKVPAVSIARSTDEAVLLSGQIGYPVVMKIHSVDITHKTDVGGVKLGLQTPEQVRVGYEHMLREVRLQRPGARLDGVTLQPMIDRTDCVELIVGIKRDPTFGPVVMVGFGGVAAELFADRVVELLPIGSKRAESMLKRLKCWPLLDGYRGKPRVAVDEAIKVIELVARLASQCEWIEELDINPILVGPRGAVALDGRVVVKNPS
jgi:acetyltransferase